MLRCLGSAPGGRPARRSPITSSTGYKTGRQRWHTIGRHGAPWTPDQARDEAKRLLLEIARGSDPVRRQADRPHRGHRRGALRPLPRRRRSRAAADTAGHGEEAAHSAIRPQPHRRARPAAAGPHAVAAVTREDVDAFMHAVAEGKTATRAKTGKKRGLSNVRGGMGTASRTVGLLGAIFTYAVRHRMRADNPVHGVMRPADGKRERRLSDDDMRPSGSAAVAEAEAVWPAAVAAARFLALTGWRSGEALGLRWADIDLGRRTATLSDTKTGRSMRPLSHAACDVLRALGRGADAALVFPADPRRRPDERVPEVLGSHRQTAGAADRLRRMCCAIPSPPLLPTSDIPSHHCCPGRAQGHSITPLCPFCRYRAAGRGRCRGGRNRGPHGRGIAAPRPRAPPAPPATLCRCELHADAARCRRDFVARVEDDRGKSSGTTSRTSGS